MWMEEESRAVIEAILFASGPGADKNKLAALLKMQSEQLAAVVERMQEDYQSPSRGLQIIVDGDWIRLGTKPELTELLETWLQVPGKRLSPAAVETLAVIAYRQPVTRAEIEHIRGVRVDRVLQTLLERELVCETGVRRTVGQPPVYGTTELFLQVFGLDSLQALPELTGLRPEEG
jgi:segregation and condensation protein B